MNEFDKTVRGIDVRNSRDAVVLDNIGGYDAIERLDVDGALELASAIQECVKYIKDNQDAIDEERQRRYLW